MSSFFRTAIFYNVVSSVFAAFGLLAGLLLGSQEGLSSWLLSATVTNMNTMMGMMGRMGMAVQDDFIAGEWNGSLLGSFLCQPRLNDDFIIDY